VKNEVDSVTGFRYCLRVIDVGFAEVDLVADTFQVPGLAGAEIIDAAYLVSASHERACQRRADKTGNPSD
jgi:hypothetical protein